MAKTQASKRQIKDRCAFYVQMSADVSVGDFTQVVAEFDTEVYDHGGNFNTTTHQFTAPYHGIYHFDASLRYSTIDDTRFAQTIVDTSNTDMGSSGEIAGFVESVAANDFIYPQNSCDLELDAGDTVQIVALHNNGTTESIDSSGDFTFFMGHLVMRLD